MKRTETRAPEASHLPACSQQGWTGSRLRTMAFALALAVSGSGPWIGARAAGPASGSAPGAGNVTLDFIDADIESVARAMAVMTGHAVIVDPRVKGTVTLKADKPVPVAQAYNQFLAALRLQGFTVVQAGGIDKVVMEADAKLQSEAVNLGPKGPATNQVVTQIFKLNYESANNLVPVLRPLISPNNTITVSPNSNQLIVTDYADNLQRVARIIAALDLSTAASVEVIPLQYAVASDLAVVVARLAEADGGSGPAAAPGAGASPTAAPTGASGRLSVLAEPRSNALILRAPTRAQLEATKDLIARLDRPAAGSNGESGNIWVVHLRNADANRLAATLRGALSGAGSGAAPVAGGATSLSPVTAGATSAAGPGAALARTSGTSAGAGTAYSGGGMIQADPTTNSLIITASEPQYRQIRAVIDKLDARRAQVFVESMIAEVDSNKAAQLGIQWQSALGSAGGTVGLLGTNFGTGGNNLLNLNTQAGGTVLPGNGFNIGVASPNSGVYVLGFLANLLESNGDGNVLSTPNLLTLDNEEATIVVGQNVPFVTGQYSTTGSAATVTPFQTIERKDVGLTLKVRPQISENGTVKMSIYQEVSSIDSTSTATAGGLVIAKRSIETNVLVNDGGIVVLGGLLQDQYSGSQQKVPGLGDIPLLGYLFRSDSRTRTKTNLMVFLRPVVVRDEQTSDALSRSRFEDMRRAQTAAQPTQHPVIPINESVQMDALPPPAAAGATGAPPPASGPAAPPVATPLNRAP